MPATLRQRGRCPFPAGGQARAWRGAAPPSCLQLRQTLDHDRIIFLEIVMDDSLCEQMVRLKVLSAPGARRQGSL